MVIALLLVAGILGGGAVLALGGLNKLKSAFGSSSAADYPGPGERPGRRSRCKPARPRPTIAKTLEGPGRREEHRTPSSRRPSPTPTPSKLQPGIYQLRPQDGRGRRPRRRCSTRRRGSRPRVTLPEGLRLDETLQLLAKDTKIPLKQLRAGPQKQHAETLGLPDVRRRQPGGLPLPGHLRRRARRRRRLGAASSCSPPSASRPRSAGVERTPAHPVRGRHRRQPGPGRGAQPRGLRQGRPRHLQPARAGACRCSSTRRSTTPSRPTRRSSPTRTSAPTRRTTPTRTPGCRRHRSTRPGEAALEAARQPDRGRLAVLRHRRPADRHDEVHRRLPGVPEVQGRAEGQPVTQRRAAVLGSPIGHSLSPVLHRAAYEHLGLSDWTYDGVRRRRGRPGRASSPGSTGVGGAVADDAAQGRRAAAARRRLAGGRDWSARPTPCCCGRAAGSGSTPTCPAWSRRSRRTRWPGVDRAVRARRGSDGPLGGGRAVVGRPGRCGPTCATRRGTRACGAPPRGPGSSSRSRRGPGPPRGWRSAGGHHRPRGRHRPAGPGRSAAGRGAVRRASTTRGRHRSPPPGRPGRRWSSTGSTCWCTRPCCRWR